MDILRKTSFRKTGSIVLFLVFAGVSTGWAEEKKGENGQLLFGPPDGFDRSCLLKQEERSVEEMMRTPPSRAKAFALSFLLPGAGEYYAGSKKMAKVFFITEVFLWTTFASFRIYGNWKKDDYRQMAVAYAGVDLTGKDHQYFVDIGNYDSIQEYNAAVLRERDADALYPENDDYDWEWESEEMRLEFRRSRIASDAAYNRSLLVIGAVILNHIVSGIDALRLARAAEKSGERKVELDIVGLPDGEVRVVLSKHF